MQDFHKTIGFTIKNSAIDRPKINLDLTSFQTLCPSFRRIHPHMGNFRISKSHPRHDQVAQFAFAQSKGRK